MRHPDKRWFVSALAGFLFLSVPPAFVGTAMAGPTSCRCYCGKVLRPPCSDSACKAACGYQAPGSSGGYTAPGGYSAPSIDYEAERRRREAEEAERRRAEEERQRQEEEKFRVERDAAARMLKGSSPGGTSGLKGLGDTDNHGLKGVESRIGRELKAIEGDSRDARDAAANRNLEGASRRARGGFDTGASRDRGTLVIPGISGQRPTTLDSKVPKAARNDPKVKEMLEWYRKLDGQKAEAEKKIAELRKQQAASKDPILAVKIETLNNNVKQYTSDQAVAEKTAKKRVEVDLGLSWDDKPSAGGTGAKK